MDEKRNFFRYVGDEESQNDFFASLLAWSLEDSPEVLNAIHDDVEFGDRTEVVATQRSGLPRNSPENPGNRILDWVVQDRDKLVGYESKTGGGTPSVKQLREERRKLEVNSGGRDVVLFAFTDHAQQPTTVKEAPAEWLSWYLIAERVLTLDTEDKSIRMLQEMFRDNGYEGFTGFTEFTRDNRWLTKHGSELVDLAYDVDRHLEAMQIYTQGNTHLWHSTSMNLEKIRANDWSTINQAYHMIHFHPDGEPEHVENHYRIGIFLPALENDLHVYMDVNANKRRQLRNFVRENSTALAGVVEDRDMHLRTSWSSFNSPTREFLEYEALGEVTDVLAEKAGRKNWKRLLFGWDVPTDQAARGILRETIERIEELYDIFYEGSEYLSKDELPKW